MVKFGTEMRLPVGVMSDEPPSEEPPDYPPFGKKEREILKGLQERVEQFWSPDYVARRTSTMHAVIGNQDRTKLVIWYGWRKRPSPGGCIGSSIVPGARFSKLLFFDLAR